jgi:hypothetical protein
VSVLHVADEQESGGKPRATMGTGQRFATYRGEKEKIRIDIEIFTYFFLFF